MDVFEIVFNAFEFERRMRKMPGRKRRFVNIIKAFNLLSASNTEVTDDQT